MNYLDKYTLLHKNQSGFRNRHSTESALILMTDTWLKAMNEGKLVGCAMIVSEKLSTWLIINYFLTNCIFRSFWPTLFLLNVSTALKGTHNYVFICCHCSWCCAVLHP